MRYKVWMKKPQIFATLLEAMKVANAYFYKTGVLVGISACKRKSKPRTKTNRKIYRCVKF